MLAEPPQTEALPVIAPGVAGAEETVTAIVCAVLVPQPLLAVTEMFPPEAPAVAEIEFDVEVPVQPDGNVQL